MVGNENSGRKPDIIKQIQRENEKRYEIARGSGGEILIPNYSGIKSVAKLTSVTTIGTILGTTSSNKIALGSSTASTLTFDTDLNWNSTTNALTTGTSSAITAVTLNGTNVNGTTFTGTNFNITGGVSFYSNASLYFDNGIVPCAVIYTTGSDAETISLHMNGSPVVKAGHVSGNGTPTLGFFNVTNIQRPTTAGAASTFVSNTSLIANDTATWDGYTIGQLVKALRNYGLLT